MIYDHERDGAEARRGRNVADWGGDDLFTSMPRRRAKHASARPRRATSSATGTHAVRRGPIDDHRQAASVALQRDEAIAGRDVLATAAGGRETAAAVLDREAVGVHDVVATERPSRTRGPVAMPEPLELPDAAIGRRFV